MAGKSHDEVMDEAMRKIIFLFLAAMLLLMLR